MLGEEASVNLDSYKFVSDLTLFKFVLASSSCCISFELDEVDLGGLGDFLLAANELMNPLTSTLVMLAAFVLLVVVVLLFNKTGLCDEDLVDDEDEDDVDEDDDESDLFGATLVLFTLLLLLLLLTIKSLSFLFVAEFLS